MKTLEFTAYDILQKYNFSKEDAQALIDYMKEASKDEVATKNGVKLEIDGVKKEIDVVKKETLEIRHELDLIRSEIKIAAHDTKSSLIQWMAGLMIGQVAVIFAILKMTNSL